MPPAIIRWLVPALIAGATYPAFAQQPQKFQFDQKKIDELLKGAPKSAPTSIDATIKGKDSQAEIFKGYRNSINKCWNFLITDKTVPEVILEVRYSIDGKLEGDPKLVNPVTKAAYLRAAAAAVDAVTRCQPISLPREHYQSWKAFQIVFDPKLQ